MSPRDSDNESVEEMFSYNDDDEDLEYDEGDMENAIILDENDAPELHDAMDDLDVEEDPENAEEIENGFIPDDSKMIFQKHDGSIFCIAVSPQNNDLMVSGGEDDKGVLLKMSTDEELFELKNHKDSVVCCGFNSDGKYVMTADMSGTIIVRNVEDGKMVWDFDCGDLEWCKWHSKANVIFGGTADGDIYMWKIPSGDCKIFQTHGSKSTCSILSASGKELFAGYEDGSVKMWDLKAGTAVFQDGGDQEDPVICVTGQSNGKVFACGTNSGLIRLYNETGKSLTILNDISNSNEDEEKSIEGLVFQDEHYLASCSLNGKVCIWDTQTQRIRHEFKDTSGVSHIVWLNKSNNILAVGLDGVLKLWSLSSGSIEKELQGHRGHVLDVQVFDNEKFVLTAGDDETCRVFEL
ncbi:angio-associated migratory cell protein-like [Clytia hemisphaerica]|uniref:Pyrrolo-quinoline quinone repeat domain-containing protein n=1 Tax=Clytia hemisphaerica TaxID=252671 RepID=A0A7M5X2J1_9CNID